MDEKMDDGIEVLDMENFRSGGKQTFDYEFLVMKAISNCIEAGRHEMREGWFNESFDNHGNLKRSYVEDTRKRLIESIRTLYGLLVRVFDEEAEEKIGKLFNSIQREKERLLGLQWAWYESLPPIPKESFKGRVIKGVFNLELGWYQAFVEYEIIKYREIFIELMKLVKRNDDFAGEEYEA